MATVLAAHCCCMCCDFRPSWLCCITYGSIGNSHVSQRDRRHQQHTCLRSPDGAPIQELGTKDENSLHGGLVVTVLVKFLYLFAASMLLGLAFGLGTSFLMKRAKSNSVPQVQQTTRTPHISPSLIS